MDTWIPVREAIPWLPLPPYLVDSDDQWLLRDRLRDLGFQVFEADVAACTDERCVLVALGDALGFPDYYGANWAAFEDCVGDMVREGAGTIALLVNGCDTLHDSDLRAFVRSVHLLSDVVAEVERVRSRAFQLEFFFLGEWGDRAERAR